MPAGGRNVCAKDYGDTEHAHDHDIRDTDHLGMKSLKVSKTAIQDIRTISSCCWPKGDAPHKGWNTEHRPRTICPARQARNHEQVNNQSDERKKVIRYNRKLRWQVECVIGSDGSASPALKPHPRNRDHSGAARPVRAPAHKQVGGAVDDGDGVEV